MDYDSIKSIEDLRCMGDGEIVALMRIDLTDMLTVFFKHGSREPFDIVVKLGALQFTKTFERKDWVYLRRPDAGKFLTRIATSAALREIKLQLSLPN